MKQRHRRIAFVILSLCGLSAALGLGLRAFNDNIVFFLTPSQVTGGEAPQGRSFRMGGLVEAGSLRRSGDGLTVHFTMTDTLNSIPVVYTGILPDLFKEGSGCVAQGRLGTDGTFYADEVLAKHDENYMPIEVESSVRKKT
jgi:cytochrome c-type biogenesis protein CcmE